MDDDGTKADDTGSATVTIDDVAPTVQVDKSADPTHLNEPGGTVTFTVDVKNTSSESVTLTDLVDDIYGDLLTTPATTRSATAPAPTTR